jgi:hypothetical protein
MDLPVRYIVVDDTQSLPFGKLLEDAVLARPQDFAPMGRFPIDSTLVGVARRLGEVHVYENRGAGNRRPAVVRVQLGLEREGRVLEYHWN